MPAYNRAQFLDEAIRSVIDQDFSDFELVIVDDGSTDRTPDLLREWSTRDPRIVIVTLPDNRGIPHALNAGIDSARGRLIARLDSDDLTMPLRLAAQAELLDTRADVILASSSYDLIDIAGRHLGTWTGDEPHEVVVHFLNFYNIVGGGGQVMFRRTDVVAEGGYSCDYPSSEDYDLWVRLLRRGRIVTLPLIGMRQRDHGDRSLSRYASIKRANWTAIMRGSLEPYLQRTVSDDEIAALITLWRHDGALGMGPSSDRTMREAYGRFCSLNCDTSLRRLVRRRTARQWLEAAAHFAKRRQQAEAARYVARAARWDWKTVLRQALPVR